MSSNVDCIGQQQDAWQRQQQQRQQLPQHRRRGRWPTSATVCRIVFLAATCQRVDLLPLPLSLPLPHTTGARDRAASPNGRRARVRHVACGMRLQQVQRRPALFALCVARIL